MQETVDFWVSVICTIVIAFATVVLAILTRKYVYLTRSLMEETKRSREPLVAVDFEIPSHGRLSLIIANYGQSPAKNIQITVLKDVDCTQNQPSAPYTSLATLDPVKNGISYLTPGRKLKYTGIMGLEILDREISISVRINYEDETGKPYENLINYDFTQLRGVLFETFKDPSLAIAEAIRDVERSRKTTEHITSWIQPVRKREMKLCPMCAEEIPIEAKKCSHCQETLDKKSLTVLNDDIDIKRRVIELLFREVD